MRSPPEADAIHRHRTGLAPEIAILNGGVRPDLLDCPKWLALAPPAFALASPSPRPGGARAKAGGAVPLVEPELSPLSLSTARKTLDDGNDGAQVTTLGQRDPIDYPNRSAVDYLDHAHPAFRTFSAGWLQEKLADDGQAQLQSYRDSMRKITVADIIFGRPI